MTSKRVYGARAAKAVRASSVIRSLATVSLGLLGFVLSGCDRHSDSAGHAPRPAVEAGQPTLSSGRIPPPDPPAADLRAERHVSSLGATLASETRAFPDASSLKSLVLVEAKTEPEPVAPGDAPRLSVTVRHGPEVEKMRLRLEANGQVYDRVLVRYRGQWARSWPKKPLKIFFNHDKLFEGHHCLNLNSGWRDPAFVRETLAYQTYAACGVPAPESRMVRLDLNGQFRGLYVEIEQPEKAFLNRLNLKGAAVFKAISRSNQA